MRTNRVSFAGVIPRPTFVRSTGNLMRKVFRRWTRFNEFSTTGTFQRIGMHIHTDVASFGEKRHPYYIFGADYRETSGGVTALHYLCHALNKAGESAYLFNTKISKPGLNVRFLAETDCRHHKSFQAVPIVVYPEIVSDN